MYIRATHEEADLRVLRQLIRENSLGLLTTGIQSPAYRFLQSSHIPFVLDVEDETSETELGRLRGHLARQNPQSKAIIETLTSNPQPDNVLEQEVLIIFDAPSQHYITPKFYVETKPTTGKVVPTWNYAAAQVYGKAKVFFDSKAEETASFLTKQIDDLTYHNERAMGYTGGDQPTAWKVTDAPERYVETLRKNIIGIEITIERLEGKFKMSQEMEKTDREGVADGLATIDSNSAQAVSRIVRERSERKEAERAQKA